MGQKTEMLDTARNIARSLIEGIVDEVMKTVVERKDSCFGSLESVKLQSTEYEDILTVCALKTENVEKSKVLENLGPLSTTPLLDDGCYPSFANLQDVCVLSSAQSSTNKQGEGDYQPPTIREATAFYRLGLETDECCQGRSQYRKSFSVSSLNTETSTNELIADMRSDINNLSFDNIQLSDTDADDEPEVRFDRADDGVNDEDVLIPPMEDNTGSPISHETEDASQEHQGKIHGNKDVLEQFQNSDSCFDSQHSSHPIYKNESIPSNKSEIEDHRHLDDFDQNASEDCQISSSHKNGIQHSRKFCQIHDKRYLFPLNSDLPHDYLQLDGPSSCDQNTKDDEEGYELLSESSHELISVEGETESFDLERDYPSRNLFENPFLEPNIPSSLVISIDGPSQVQDNSEKPDKEIKTITVVAEVEHPKKKLTNWEEALEVQLNVTEPVKSSETDNEEEDGSVFQTREYWSNVGLIIEHEVDPTYLGPSTVPGIESVKGVTRVKEKCLGHGADDDIWVTKSQRMDDSVLQANCEFRADEKLNCLSFPRGAESKKKKRKGLVSRLTTAISCVFRSKKKNTKVHS